MVKSVNSTIAYHLLRQFSCALTHFQHVVDDEHDNDSDIYIAIYVVMIICVTVVTRVARVGCYSCIAHIEVNL